MISLIKFCDNVLGARSPGTAARNVRNAVVAILVRDGSLLTLRDGKETNKDYGVSMSTSHIVVYVAY